MELKKYIFKFKCFVALCIIKLGGKISRIGSKIDPWTNKTKNKRLLQNVSIGSINSHYFKYKNIEEIKNNVKISYDERTYPWSVLKKDIAKNGVLEDIEVCPSPNKNFLYNAYNGNHRLAVLKDLYGKNYKINVQLVKWKDRK
tara:strand:- start:3274 stop:3702 length:429 start_codon:yes stop_codon:yes gene_type:complete